MPAALPTIFLEEKEPLVQAILKYSNSSKKGNSFMADLYIAVKTDPAETPLGVGKSVRDLERRLGLNERTLEYTAYHGKVNKRLQLQVRKIKI